MTREEVENIITLYNNILDATNKEPHDPKNQESIPQIFINNGWMQGLLNAIQIGGWRPIFVGDTAEYSLGNAFPIDESYIVKALYEGPGLDDEIVHFETSIMKDLLNLGEH